MKNATKLKSTIAAIVFVSSMTLAYCQDTCRRHSIGTSFALIRNFNTKEPPLYFELNYGYQFTPKDVIVLEAITWTVYEPMGIPLFSSGESYPGKIRSYGLGVGYQHFFWKGLYSTIQATPFLQQYFDSDDEKIQNGFQAFLQLRIGYRIELFKHRFFVEHAIAFNYWPINTNVPSSFAEIESGWPNYFLFEPSVHFGFKL